jgi:glycosyltransferase involved in cell wall biosynthesis
VNPLGSSVNPLVSVVVPTYNGESFVRATLDSIFAQTYRPFEVIVCDDGSSDGTLAILRELEGRIHLVQQKNQGVAAARNRASLEARGEMIAFLDHDDLWEPNMLATLVPMLVAEPGVRLAYADAWIIDSASQVRGRRGTFLSYASGDVLEPLLHGNFIPVETTLMRAQLFRELCGCDPSLRYLEDYELCLRAARATRVAFHPEPLARYRIHERNLSHEIEPMLVEWLRLIDSLEERVGPLTGEQATVVERERRRLCVDLAWRALRHRDLAASDGWMRRAGPHGPAAKSMRVRALRLTLGMLPASAGDALLRLLPRRKLYGVQIEASHGTAAQR